MMRESRPGFGLNDVLAQDCSVPDCSDQTVEAPFPICAAHYAALLRHFHETVNGNGYTRDLYGTYEDVPLIREQQRDPERVIYFHSVR